MSHGRIFGSVWPLFDPTPTQQRRGDMLPLSVAPLAQDPCVSSKVFRDPIVNFAYGGRADFRGIPFAVFQSDESGVVVTSRGTITPSRSRRQSHTQPFA